jgi:predicted metal-dependent hydrolase
MLMPDLLEEGRILFNNGRFFEAHEVWEDLWRTIAESRLKMCCQGLIQAAVGLHHLHKGNTIGARSQLQKSIRNLEGRSAEMPELDIAGLIDQLTKLLENSTKATSERPVITRWK